MTHVLQLLTTPDDRVGFALLAMLLGYLGLAVATRGAGRPTPTPAQAPPAGATPPPGALHG
ncbi:MAG: hypothetical protein IPH07_31800 [Deltaproteobacteria bacterium]|nr:hypothetical protein [Deltaproteobacteria bacterium]